LGAVAEDSLRKWMTVNRSEQFAPEERPNAHETARLASPPPFTAHRQKDGVFLFLGAIEGAQKPSTVKEDLSWTKAQFARLQGLDIDSSFHSPGEIATR